MTCEQIRAQLTAYLDGELEDERGSAVRGHLRGCETCRQAATDEAALRDGLRALPAVDPPASLWTNVQARLAAAEIADAKRPAWRAALVRWFAPRAIVPRLPWAGAAVAAVVLVFAWRAHRASTDAPPTTPLPPVASAVKPPAPTDRGDARDISVDLAALPAAQTQGYADAAAELMKLATDARVGWSDSRKQTFDARLAELKTTVEHADEGAPRQRAYRGLIRYLQGVVVRDEFAINDHTLAGGTR